MFVRLLTKEQSNCDENYALLFPSSPGLIFVVRSHALIKKNIRKPLLEAESKEQQNKV